MKIQVRNVFKRYPLCPALEEVSLEIDPGQIVAVLGPNGAGKTTLLRCLSGMAVPERGEILFDGRIFRRDQVDLRQRLHFLTDFPTLFAGQTVLRNIAVMLRLYGRDAPGVEERVVALLKEFDILPHARLPANSLSRGQSYKAALVGLLAADPELWLLDEPFASGMDPHGINAFKDHARSAAARGRTILYTTQLLDVVERFADRVCVIHKGRIVAFDTMARLRERAGGRDGVLEELFRDLRERDR